MKRVRQRKLQIVRFSLYCIHFSSYTGDLIHLLFFFLLLEVVFFILQEPHDTRLQQWQAWSCLTQLFLQLLNFSLCQIEGLANLGVLESKMLDVLRHISSSYPLSSLAVQPPWPYKSLNFWVILLLAIIYYVAMKSLLWSSTTRNQLYYKHDLR